MEINNELIRSLGMTLVHSLWEGLVILGLVILALSVAGRKNAKLRYIVLVSGHLLLLAGFLSTWYIVYHHNLAAAIKPLAKVYTQVNGFVSGSPIVLRTANYTSTLKQILEPFYPALAMGWILGFLFMVIRTAGGFYWSYTIMKKDVFHPDPQLMALFEKAKTRLMMPVALKLRMSSRQISPMVIGLIKPCVVVPVAILSGLNTEQVEAILVHELAHIRRYDHVLMIMQAIITQVLFFHPVAWYISAEINRERENCCDDLVIKTFPNPINYIKALTMIQEMNTDGQVPANALLGGSKRLLGRVKRLLNTEKRHAPVFRMAAIFFLLVTLGIAAITIASAGNSGPGKNLVNYLGLKPDKMQLVTDTIKNTRKEKSSVNSGSMSAQDSKKEKELNEAKKKLEKAQFEMQKARLELQKAREEYFRAGGQMRHELADLSEERAKHLMTEDQMQEFKLQREKQFAEQRWAMELQRRAMEDMRRSQEDLRRSQDVMRGERIRQQDMKREMERFYRMQEDSGMHMRHRNPYMEDYPEAPVPPPLPPADDAIPDMPDIEIPALPEPPEVEHLVQPEPVVPMELINKDQETENKETTTPLDTKLKEVETE